MSKSVRYLVVACWAMVVLVIFTGTGYAERDEKSRLGETIAQCDQRYGRSDITGTVSSAGNPLCIVPYTLRHYDKDGIKITVFFVDGKRW